MPLSYTFRSSYGFHLCLASSFRFHTHSLVRFLLPHFFPTFSSSHPVPFSPASCLLLRFLFFFPRGGLSCALLPSIFFFMHASLLHLPSRTLLTHNSFLPSSHAPHPPPPPTLLHLYPPSPHTLHFLLSQLTSNGINFIKEDDTGLLCTCHLKQFPHHPRTLQQRNTPAWTLVCIAQDSVARYHIRNTYMLMVSLT